MSARIIKTFIAFYFLCLFASCDTSSCQNTNSIFIEYSPDSHEYKNELVNQLAKLDISELTYWMDNFQENNDSKYIYANIKGKELCAKIVLEIIDSEKGIEGILRNKGKGYSGAKLENLKFDIRQDSLSTKFIFKEISRVID